MLAEAYKGGEVDCYHGTTQRPQAEHVDLCTKTRKLN